VSTAVLLAIGAFVILIFVRQHAISQAESAAVFHSRFVVRSVLGDRLRPDDFARPVGPDRTAMLDSVVQSDILVGDSRALELYSRDGHVTYSTTRSQVGTVPTDAAKARSTLVDGNVAKSVEMMGGRKVLKVFVPVPFIGPTTRPACSPSRRTMRRSAPRVARGCRPSSASCCSFS
jgi:hypothetical protein